MTIDDPPPSQPQLLLHCIWLFCAVAQVLHGGATKAGRRSRKIIVPLGYKFSPTDDDLVNYHLQRKLKNVNEEHCLIPEHNHYEDEPWDLINKYNELSDGESSDDMCFFFSTSRSSKRVQRRTPKGHWHETSEKKMIEGSDSDGVVYVMRYFTFYNGHRPKKRDITAWRMREFTDPSKKELALCKIFKDVDGPKKKKDGPSSIMSEPSTSIPISPESRTPEVREAGTPISANLTNNNMASSQWQATPFDESEVPTSLSDPNLMDYGVISSSQWQATPFDESEVPTSLSDPSLMDYGVISSSQWQATPFDESEVPTSLSDPNLMDYGVISSSQWQATPFDESEVPTSLSDPNLMDYGVISSSQWQATPFDESEVPTSLSDPNLMDYGVISSYQQQPSHAEEGYPPSQNKISNQILDYNNSGQYVPLSYPKLRNEDVISSYRQQPVHSEEGTPFAQNAFADQFIQCSPPDDEFIKEPLDSHNNTGDAPHSKRPRVEGTSIEASQQPPMKRSRIPVDHSQNLGKSLEATHMDLERNFSSRSNSPFNSSMSSSLIGNNMHTAYGCEEVNSKEIASHVNPPPTQSRNLDSSNYMVSSQHQLQVPQPHENTGPVPDCPNMRDFEDQEFLAWLFSCIPDDDILTPNSTNIEGHSNDSTASLSPSNHRTSDKVNSSEPTSIETHERVTTLSTIGTYPHSPTQPCNIDFPNHTTAQQMDMSNIYPIEVDHPFLLELAESNPPLFL